METQTARGNGLRGDSGAFQEEEEEEDRQGGRGDDRYIGVKVQKDVRRNASV